MECIGARNFAALAVSKCPITKLWTKNRIFPSKNHVFRYVHTIKCSSSSSRTRNSEGFVAVKEGFADEEDYVKGGGSELLYVQMQQNKLMDDQQSKLSDKLPEISSGNTILDLVVIGCGPAGLALAAESAKIGLSVGLIGPDIPFTNNYGVWEDEFKDLGLAGCIEHVWRDAIVYLDDKDPISIGRAYGRVSRHLLHEELLKRCFISQLKGGEDH